jgi:hypothetical protein
MVRNAEREVTVQHGVNNWKMQEEILIYLIIKIK